MESIGDLSTNDIDGSKMLKRACKSGMSTSIALVVEELCDVGRIRAGRARVCDEAVAEEVNPVGLR
jgi:hypothetical protein